jgi:UDP:flavonoid glycosyltransferase YjiC (YdhE family)
MNENAARLDWAGAGVRLPRRLIKPRAIALAVERALEDQGIRERARMFAHWSRTHDAGAEAARLVCALARARTAAGISHDSPGTVSR